MTYKIIDNLCGAEVNDNLHRQTVTEWLWAFNPFKVHLTDQNSLYDYQFVHKLHSITEQGYSPHWQDIIPVISQINGIINIGAFRRVKANFQVAQKDIVYGSFHYDLTGKGIPDENLFIAIYYVNTNNGYTEFEDGTKINSVADRLVIFKNNIKHRGVSQTDTKQRIVINFNFYSPSYVSLSNSIPMN
tara:strand:+ start:760 stop:1323 length:564 start_codon:yes stop_codon:yes gene_type:complete